MKSGLVSPSCCEMFLIIFIRRQSFIFRALFMSIFSPFPRHRDKHKLMYNRSSVFTIIIDSSNRVVHTNASLLKPETESRLKSVVQHQRWQRIICLPVQSVSSLEDFTQTLNHYLVIKCSSAYLHTWAVHSSCLQQGWYRWRWSRLRFPPRCAHTAFALARHKHAHNFTRL